MLMLGHAHYLALNLPRWLQEPGWLQAGQLRVGDQLRTAAGTDVPVTGLRYNVGHAAVYTLTVAHDHTFFVGTAQGAGTECTRLWRGRCYS